MPPDKKKRILVALAGMAVALVFMGFFFWPILRDLNRDRQNGGNHSNAPLLIFGGFFLVMVLLMVVSVVSGIRKFQNQISPHRRRAKISRG